MRTEGRYSSEGLKDGIVVVGFDSVVDGKFEDYYGFQSGHLDLKFEGGYILNCTVNKNGGRLSGKLTLPDGEEISFKNRKELEKAGYNLEQTGFRNLRVPVRLYTLMRKVETKDKGKKKKFTATSHCLSRMGYKVFHGQITDFSENLRFRDNIFLQPDEEEKMSSFELRQDVKNLEDDSLRSKLKG